MKKWYLSKTVWVNALALLSVVAWEWLGIEIKPETVAIVLTVINFVLRTVTKENIVW